MSWIYMEPNSLVQGWDRACAIFTKVTRQVVRMWRSQGKVVCHILDDVLVAAGAETTEAERDKIRDDMLRDLQHYGFFVNWKKCVLKWTKCLKWVGYVLHTVREPRLYVPGDYIEQLEGIITTVVATDGKAETCRSVASLV